MDVEKKNITFKKRDTENESNDTGEYINTK